MSKIRCKIVISFSLLLVIHSSSLLADSYYCESNNYYAMPPESLKLSIFDDGSASAVLSDQSVWIQDSNKIELSGTEIFYRFQLKPQVISKRESLLELYLSRFSLRLYGRREEILDGKVISISQYDALECNKEAVMPKP